MRKRLSLWSNAKLSLAKAMGRFVPSCEQVSLLVSNSMEEKLPLRIKIRVTIHLLMCQWCRRFKQQVRQIRALIRNTQAEADNAHPHSQVTLSDSARERMEKALGSPDK